MALELQHLPVDAALKLATTYVKNSTIAKQMGKNETILTSAASHCMMNGKPYYLPSVDVPLLQAAITDIGYDLVNTTIKYPKGKTHKTLTDSEKDLLVSEIKELSYTIKLNSIAITILGKNRSYYSRRMCEKPECYANQTGQSSNSYGKFKPEDIAELNKSVHEIGAILMSIRVTEDYEQNELLSNCKGLMDEPSLEEDEAFLGLV